MIPQQHFDASELAALLGVEPKWVWNQKAKGVITPLFRHEREQYDRVAVVRRALILALADVFGDRSGAPRKIVEAEANSGAIAQLATDLDTTESAGMLGDEPIKLRFDVGACLVEIRPRIVAALRARMPRVTS